MMQQYCRLTDALEIWLRTGKQDPDTGEIDTEPEPKG